jgi:hypothetical protein
MSNKLLHVETWSDRETPRVPSMLLGKYSAYILAGRFMLLEN